MESGSSNSLFMSALELLKDEKVEWERGDASSIIKEVQRSMSRVAGELFKQAGDRLAAPCTPKISKRKCLAQKLVDDGLTNQPA